MAAAAGLTTPDNNLAIRDVASDFFKVVAPQTSELLGMLMANPGQCAPARNNKHEWLEDVLLPLKYTLTAYSAGSATVDNTNLLVAKAEVGTIVEVVTAAGVNTGVQAKITAINTGTNVFTLSAYPVGSTLTVGATDTLEEISRPRPENSLAETGIFGLGTPQYNATEILSTTIGISGTTIETPTYGAYNDEQVQLKRAMQGLAQRMSKGLFRGSRVLRTAGENGTMGGIRSFVTGSGANVYVASGTTLTNDMLNSVLNGIRDRGGQIDDVVFVANGRHSGALAKLSQANGGVTAMNITNNGGESSFGFGAKTFTSSLGTTHRIIYDAGMTDTSTVYVLNLNEMGVVPLGNRDFAVLDATQPGQDGVAKRVRGEFTLVIRNAKEKHGAITGLIV